MSNNAYAIDANVILRHLLGDNNELSPRARSIFESVEDGLTTVFCDPVNLAEAVWVMKSVYKLLPGEISSELLNLVTLEGFRMPNKQVYIKALRLYGVDIPHFGDACACAAAMEQCGGRLLSFDKRLSGTDGINRAESV